METTEGIIHFIRVQNFIRDAFVLKRTNDHDIKRRLGTVIVSIDRANERNVSVANVVRSVELITSGARALFALQSRSDTYFASSERRRLVFWILEKFASLRRSFAPPSIKNQHIRPRH